jgi:ElaB/YqjD/DUF883 family membrane-anchored ribosome-binding protein
MAEDPNALERDIAEKRRELGGHLEELESRLQEAADWRTYVRRRPLSAFGAAFGAGVAVALLLGL